MASTDDLTVTITGPDGETDDLTLPAGLVEMLAEEGDDDVQVVADIAQLAFTGRAHALVHHTEDEPDDELRAVEERALELFEERFGVSYGEATGHQH